MQTSECPECGKSLATQAKRCSCGWRQLQVNTLPVVDHRCQYVSGGHRCPLPGTISPSVFGSTWYCSGHLRTLDDPQAGEAVLMDAEKRYDQIMADREDWRKKLFIDIHKKRKKI
jgi:hypothetical protein